MAESITLQRVNEAERIPSLDILRGIAILFILFMNIPWMGGFSGPPVWDFRFPTWTSADWWTTLIVESGFGGTQRGLLELLFGAGIMIMARKAMTPDGPVAVADLHYRRNLWLIVFGLANAFLLMWAGDILLVYGIAAVFLFPFRRMGPKGQLGFAALILGAMLYFNMANYSEATQERARVTALADSAAAGKVLSAEDRKAVEAQQKADRGRALMPMDNPDKAKALTAGLEARRGGFVSYWKAQTEGWMFLMSNVFFYIEGEILATMLIGMALYQWGILQGRAKRQTHLLLLIAGYGIGLALRGSMWAERLQFHPGPLWQRQYEDFARLLVTLGHLSLVHLALGTAAGRKLLAPFAAAGKIPLTIYLFTSFLMMWVIFAPWGFGMFGKWGQAQLVAVAAIVVALELVAANLWVQRFANGPMEWLWKSLAYEQRQPFRRPATVGAAPLPAE